MPMSRSTSGVLAGAVLSSTNRKNTLRQLFPLL